MTTSLAVKIVLGILAVALGIWLGLPGRYEQTPEDIEREMSWRTGGRPYRVKRHFTPMAWIQRKVTARTDHTPTRRAFQMEVPDDDEGNGENPSEKKRGD